MAIKKPMPGKPPKPKSIEIEDVRDELGDNLSLEAAPPAAIKAKVDLFPLKKKRRIMLESSEEIPPTGLFVGVNGYNYFIKPNVIVNAPLELIEVLDNAVFRVPIINPDTLKVDGYRDRMRFNYRNVNDREAA